MNVLFCLTSYSLLMCICVRVEVWPLAMSEARPFKIWNSERSIKKGTVAASLEDLLKKGKLLLGISESEQVTAVLEEDGTEISDEDYFAFIRHNTTIMLLKNNQKWLPTGAEVQFAVDEVDNIDGNTELSDRMKQLIAGLHKNITRIITLSNDDLQVIVDIDVSMLAHLLQDTENFAKSIQEACQRHLDERMQTSEAMDLLRLYHTARQSSPYVEDSGPKRQKHAHT
ncbi:DNA fragmentation factor subunit alpha-like isoform X3 [Ostrea edulis]|uniref:DNA fragmentation factor subunit alpha-like isoform X3 n=1 Tax=Ostrea edulis TaxID=37623 RepID=UPI0024AFA5DB|nr:DNA fragmentation factor subunit alpha-like isoform X3 [Ostrea edulis]